MTANSSHADRQACLAAGMNDFLSKPVRAAELYLMLCFWLGEASRPLADPIFAEAPGEAPAPAVIDLAVFDELSTLLAASIAELREGLLDDGLA